MVKRSKVQAESNDAGLQDIKKDIQKNNQSLEGQRVTNSQNATSDEILAQGEDIYHVEYSISYSFGSSNKFGDFSGDYYYFPVTWNEIFGALAPTLENGAKEKTLVEPLNFLITKVYERNFGGKGSYKNFCILKESFHTILIQIRLLGLITDANEKRMFMEDDQYWQLTTKGMELMLQVRSIRKSSF